jgi:glycosyltransferase involved in cell wall biosynthesis
VDTSQFYPAQSGRNGVVRVVNAGNMRKSKRIELMIELLSLATKKISQTLEAVIAGDGPQRELLESTARKMGLFPGVISFHGKVEDMPKFYRQADIFISTSEAEGTPNVILEAMACGLAVLSTPVGDVPAIIDHGKNGYLIDNRDLQSAEEILFELIKNDALRSAIGKSAREFILAGYSLERLKGHLADLYTCRMNS